MTGGEMKIRIRGAGCLVLLTTLWMSPIAWAADVFVLNLDEARAQDAQSKNAKLTQRAFAEIKNLMRNSRADRKVIILSDSKQDLSVWDNFLNSSSKQSEMESRFRISKKIYETDVHLLSNDQYKVFGFDHAERAAKITFEIAGSLRTVIMNKELDQRIDADGTQLEHNHRLIIFEPDQAKYQTMMREMQSFVRRKLFPIKVILIGPLVPKDGFYDVPLRILKHDGLPRKPTSQELLSEYQRVLYCRGVGL
jgi:hypothetical protein